MVGDTMEMAEKKGGRFAILEGIRGGLVVWLLLAVVVLLLPIWLSRANTFLLIEMTILALFALSFNLLLGYLGLLSFGHSAFYGLGAYALALLLLKAGVPFIPSLILAPLISALGAGIIGFFCVRRAQLYFAMLTFAFSVILYRLVFQWYSLTRGDDGLVGVPIPLAIKSTTAFAYLAGAIFLVCALLMYLIVNSPFGYVLRAIRESPRRAESCGFHVMTYQWVTFAVAGLFAGVAGSLMCIFQRGAFVEFLDWPRTGDVLIASLLGGVYVFWGPVLGSAILVLLNHVITATFHYWKLAMGVILVVLCLSFRDGILGLGITVYGIVRSRGWRGVREEMARIFSLKRLWPTKRTSKVITTEADQE